MSKSEKKKPVEIDTYFNSARLKSYFDLSKKERNIIDDLSEEGKIKNFTYVINPVFLKKIQPKLETYILFVDTRRADYYVKIKDYINSRKKQFTACLLTGDMDFIIYYTTTEIIHRNIKEEILALLNEAPTGDGGDDELVLGYKVNKFLKFKSEKCSGHYNGKEDLSLDEKINICNTLVDYRADKLVEKFGGNKKVKAYLNKIEKDNILESYYLIETVTAPKFKVIALIQYTVPGYYEKVILKNNEINKYIIDFNEVQNDSIKDDFYRRVEYFALTEFNSCEEYHKWKEDIYKDSLKNNAFINLMTFVIEDTLSEIPQTIGDLRAFEELCKKYNGATSKNIFIGNPYYYDNVETDRTINLKIDSLRDQGMIIGYQGSGKTYTSVLFAKRLIENHIRVHFFDGNGGISKIIKDDFPELIKENNVTEHTYDDIKSVELFSEKGIHVYNIAKQFLNDFVLKEIELLEKHAESPGRKTTDVIIFEEAHEIFSNADIVEKLFHLLKHAGRKGLSLWFSTQNFAHFPVNKKNVNLVSDLKNRIIQKIEIDEARAIAEFLYNSDAEFAQEISTTYEELKKIDRGQAIVSFYLGSQLKPIKVDIKK